MKQHEHQQHQAFPPPAHAAAPAATPAMGGGGTPPSHAAGTMAPAPGQHAGAAPAPGAGHAAPPQHQAGMPGMPPGAAGAAPVPPAQMDANGNALNPDHPDEQQDIALFKQLIQQYLGDGEVDNDEAMKMCQAIHSEAMMQGHPPEEAMKMAGYGMKAAALMHQKQTRESAMATEAALPGDVQDASKYTDAAGAMPGSAGPDYANISGQKQASSGSLPPSKAAQSSDTDDDGKSIEEANKRLRIENQKLREANIGLGMKQHVDRLLEKAALNDEQKNNFRLLVKDKRDVNSINEAWKLFERSCVIAPKAVTDYGFVFSAEKAMAPQQQHGSIVGFGDCLND